MVDEIQNLKGSELRSLSDVVDPIMATEAPPVVAQSQQPKQPNVRLSAEGTPLNEGPVVIGTIKVDIPNAEAQRSGFYTAHAGELVAQYRQYKFVQHKGQAKTQGVNIS